MSAAHSHPPVDFLPDRRRLGMRLLSVVGVVALGAAALAALPGLDEVRRRFGEAAPGWLVASFVLQAASCLAFVAAFHGVFSRRLGWGFSYEVGMAAQGTNVMVPAGGVSGMALGAWVLRRVGMAVDQVASRSVAFYLLTSAVNFTTLAVAGTLLAVGLLPGGGSLVLTGVPAALAAGGILAVVALPRLLPHPPAGRGRWGAGMRSVHGALTTGVRESGSLLKAGNLAVIGGSLGYMFFDVAALAAAFAAIGTVPEIGLLLVAYVIGQAGGLLPVPGGVGGTDGGLIAALVLYGTPLTEAAAAVLAYRAFQLTLPAVLGAISVLRLPGVLARAEERKPEQANRGERPEVFVPDGDPTFVSDVGLGSYAIQPLFLEHSATDMALVDFGHPFVLLSALWVVVSGLS